MTQNWHTAICSDQPRFWGVASGHRWLILDRNHADKHVASLDQRGRCDWHDKAYWGCPIAVWRRAVDLAFWK